MSGATSYSVMLAILSLSPPILGLVMLVLGLRGKRLDYHPVCRRCGYDLVGSPNPRERCPECGAGLLGDHAVRVGNRHKQPLPVVMGTLLITLSVGLLCVQLLGTNLDPYKPFWLLRLEATTPAMGSKGGALNELLTRTQSSSLSTSQLDSLMSAVLQVQADASIPWDETWGDVFAELFTQGVGAPAQHEKFAKGVYRFEMIIRPRVRLGERISIRTPYRYNRGHGDQARYYRVQPRGRVTIGELSYQLGVSTSGAMMGEGSSRTSLHTDRPPFNQLAIGSHELRLVQPIEIRLGGETGPLIGRFELLESDTFKIASADTDDIELFKDPQAAASMETGISIRQKRIKVRPRRNNPERFIADVVVNLHGTTAPFAYRVIAQSGDHEVDLGWIAYNGPMNNHSHGTDGDWPSELTADHVDLLFRPDTDAARNTVDIYRILDHEFVIEDVEVVRQP